MSIAYLRGDATRPQSDGYKVIAHICNDLGKWGRGFVVAISKRWAEPEKVYKSAYQGNSPPELGEVQFVEVSPEITVANIIGQHGVRSPRNKTAPAPIRYDAVRAGLRKVGDYAAKREATAHMPRIGCGLAGGEWSMIEPIIDEELSSKAVGIFVYDF